MGKIEAIICGVLTGFIVITLLEIKTKVDNLEKKLDKIYDQSSLNLKKD